MIAFPPIRTRRLEVRLSELTIGDEMSLCHLPENAHEKSLSEFLHCVIEDAGASSSRVANPRLWTVSERLMVLAQYNITSRTDGPDYAVTESSSISHYLDFARDLPANRSKFEAVGETWVVHPLTGAAAEAIEAMQFDSKWKGREHWLFGTMAAQLMREDEPEHPDPANEGTEYIEWLSHRMSVIAALPSSDAQEMYAHFRHAVEQDTQFFYVWFDDHGIVVLPKKEAGAETPPARFLVRSCISELALRATGKS